MKIKFQIIAVFATAFALAGCGGNKVVAPEATPADSDSVVAEVVVEEKIPEVEFDSVSYTTGDNWLDYDVSAVFPKSGPEEVVRNMRKAILRCLGQKNAAGEEDFKQVLLKDFKKRAAEAKADLLEMREYMDEEDGEDMIHYSYEDAISVDSKAPGYVTFYCIGYDYRAGAHGMPWQFRFSVDLATGNKLTWADIVKPSAKTKIKPVLKKAVIDQYFAKDVDMMDGFDLPAEDPALTEKGVWFGWGAYEIACYAAGMPECVISYDKMQDFLTDYAKEIISK